MYSFERTSRCFFLRPHTTSNSVRPAKNVRNSAFLATNTLPSCRIPVKISRATRPTPEGAKLSSSTETCLHDTASSQHNHAKQYPHAFPHSAKTRKVCHNMKLLLIHLSDIHLTSEDDPVIGRLNPIVDAVKNLDYSLDGCIVITTGDIAYSGTAEQYIVAYQWFENLKQLLVETLAWSQLCPPESVHLVMVPGNHDCDFTASGNLRDIITKSVLDFPDNAADTDIVDTCTAVQVSFFDFLNVVETLPRTPATQDYDSRLSYVYTIPIGNEVIKFVCCNTAWLSKRREVQGNLFFPNAALSTNRDDSALVIGAFHHPYNWLEADTARMFQNDMESIADLILTGHEHTSSLKLQDDHVGQNNIWTQGGVLQETGNEANSEFNVFLFDTSNYLKKYANFRWDGYRYKITNHSFLGNDGAMLGWREYRTNRKRSISKLRLSHETHQHLMDPGVTLNHSKQSSLTLPDVFVYPDLAEARTKDNRFGQRLSGDRIFELLESSPHMLITGDTESGKTSLAKMLFLDFLKRGVVPVLFDGTERPPRGDKVYGKIERLIAEQYSPSAIEDYTQTDREQKAIIIDDFHKLPISDARKDEFLTTLAGSTKYLVVFCDDLTADLNLLTGPGAWLGNSDRLTHYRIQPFGYLGRSRLVEQWLLMGEPDGPADRPFVRELAKVTQTLDTLVGKNFVPSYPVYVIAVLQAVDNATPIDMTASTHGYFYELFIKTTLARGRSNRDYDIVSSYLAFAAFRMQSHNATAITVADMRQIHSAFESHYDIHLPFDTLTKEFKRLGIYSVRDDCIKFKYRYMFNYFVAHYMKDHLSDENVEQMLTDITSNLHVEKNADILLFLAHLSKDSKIVEKLLHGSKALYPEFAPATLDEDVEFLSNLWSRFPKPVYEDSEPMANRAELLAELDRNLPNDGDANGDDEDEVNEPDADDPVVQLLTALRHVEILGQMLKNFPGSLDGSAKLDIGREACNLGLRCLSVMLSVMRSEQDSLVKELGVELRRHRPELPSRDAENLAREGLMLLIQMLAWASISRTAKAIGSRELTATYEKLLQESGSAAAGLIDAALKLDNEPQFPLLAIRKLAKELEHRPLALSILRYLVVAHFHLFPVDFRTKQRTSALLDIKYASLQVTDPKSQLLPSGRGQAAS